MKKNLLILFVIGLICQTGFSEEKVFSPSAEPLRTLSVGEKMTFKISYMGITVGEATSEVREVVKVGNREAFHIVVTARSGAILNWIYPVNDVHHSFVDVERLHSLKYEKEISEGRYRTHEMMEYDQEGHLGHFYSFKDKTRKEMFVPQNVQDQLSCAYYFRLQNLQPDSRLSIPVNADEKNWDLQAVTRQIQPMEIKGVGSFQAIEVEPLIMFEGLFVRRGKIHGWMSMDEHRIPLVMKVKVPVLGNVIATLTEYRAGSGR